MGESKRELAIKILKENACMFNSCLAKDELKRFKNYDFVQYLINYLSIPEHNYDNCHNATCKRKSRKDGYEQAIDDFVTKIKKYMETTKQATYIDEINNGNDNYSAMTIYDYVDELANELKVGEQNE